MSLARSGWVQTACRTKRLSLRNPVNNPQFAAAHASRVKMLCLQKGDGTTLPARWLPHGIGSLIFLGGCTRWCGRRQVFVEQSCLARRPASLAEGDDFDNANNASHSNGQNIARLYPRGRLRAMRAIDADTPRRHGIRGQCAAFEEARMPEVFVDARQGSLLEFELRQGRKRRIRIQHKGFFLSPRRWVFALGILA